MKTIFDKLVAVLLLIVLSPIFIILSFFIFILLGRPVFFVQERAGLRGKIFKIIKFRTMQNATHHQGALLADDQRMTKFGKFLRATSLDEIPQLFNVIKGDLSLVGPRPLLVEYLPLYTKEQARRHEVKPGITGWAQVQGRNSISWEEKFERDVWYVDHYSFWLDIKILCLTFFKVLTNENVNSNPGETMPLFLGSKNNTGN